MNPRSSFASRGLALLAQMFLCATLARAHIPFPSGTPLTIPVGEQASFYIVADVEEENPTAYSFVSNSDETVAKVQGPLEFSKKEFGSWKIEGLKAGMTTTIVFHWKYKRDASGNEGDENETVVVNVVPKGTSVAGNQYVAYVADPVSSRGGEFVADEPVGLRLGGPMALGFGVDYSSSRVAEGIAPGAMGANRRHNFEWKLEVGAQYFGETGTKALSAKVTTDRGRVVRFERTTSTGKWTQAGRADAVFGLMEEEGIYYFFAPAEQRVFVFAADGKLTRITDGRGNTHTLSYAGSTLTGVADGLGRTLAFTTTGGRFTRVTDHTGRHVDFAYTGANMTSATDPLMHATTFAYDGAGLLASFTRPTGNTPFTQVFTAGKVTAQTERTTDTTTIAYAAGETTITQPGGATMLHRYAPTGELSGYTDELDNDVAITSDATGRRNGVTDREGDATAIAYHAPSGLPATITNAEGRVMTMTYKPRLLKLDGVTDKLKALVFWDLGKITFADGTSEAFTYDARGNVTARTDRAGRKWTATFNERGQPLTMTNPTGGTVTFTYDAAGNLASSKDSATGATTYAHDALHRLTTITRPGGATMAFAYDAVDRLTSTTDERAKTTTFAYDNSDRLTGITDADTNAMQIAYDTLDRVEQITDRLGKMTSRTFDARRLVASVTDRNGNATTFAYDEGQRPVTATDAAGKTWTFGFDDESLLTSAPDPINPPTRLRRNALGRVTDASNELGQTERVARDAMQRVTQFFDPLGRATTFAYDKRGDLIGVSEEGGGAAKYTRDALGNVTQIAAPNGGVWKTTYTAEGRVQAMTDPLGKSWQRAYDTRGRLATLTFPDAATATLTYDGASNVTRTLFTDGHDFVFTYDNLNRPASATDADTAGSDLAFTYDAESRLTRSQQSGVNFDATYDDGGRLETVSYHGGAVVVTYTYDTRNRLTGVSDSLSGATVGFTHDDAGRLTGITRGNGVPSTFTLDAAGRVTRIQHGAFADLKYTRNAVGEIVQEDRTAPAPFVVAVDTETFTFGKAGEPTGAGFTHDTRGRRTARSGQSLVWDDADRLEALDATSLRYNALGEILTRSALGVTTRFFHHHAIAGSPIVSERNEAGPTVTRYYVHTPGGRLLYAIDPAAANAVAYYHFDQLGSTLALSGAGGVVTDSYSYGPFGEDAQHPTGSDAQPFTWLGALGVRREGALFQMRARYYDPRTASFVSRDPLPPRLGDVKSLNPYAYANQNPLRYVDPFGGKTFVIPHIIEDPRSRIQNTSFTFDTAIFANYVGGLAGTPTGTPVLDPPYLFGTAPRAALDRLSATAAKFGGIVHSSARGYFTQACNPASVSTPTQRKRTFAIDALISTRGGGGFTIADNESPRPRDRIIFDLNFYSNVPAASGANREGLTRSTFGFEKTFLDGQSSSGMRLGYAILVVGGGDPGGVNVQGFVTNSSAGSSAGAFDLSVFNFAPAPLAPSSP